MKIGPVDPQFYSGQDTHTTHRHRPTIMATFDLRMPHILPFGKASACTHKITLGHQKIPAPAGGPRSDIINLGITIGGQYRYGALYPKYDVTSWTPNECRKFL